jgi:hypothetical protein
MPPRIIRTNSPTKTMRFRASHLEDAVDHLLSLTDAPWVRELKHRYLQQWPLQFTRTISEGKAPASETLFHHTKHRLSHASASKSDTYSPQ